MRGAVCGTRATYRTRHFAPYRLQAPGFGLQEVLPEAGSRKPDAFQGLFARLAASLLGIAERKTELGSCQIRARVVDLLEREVPDFADRPDLSPAIVDGRQADE